MTTGSCEGCGRPLSGSKQRFCSERCRARVRRKGSVSPADRPAETGRNAAAVEELAAQLDVEGASSKMDATFVAAARELAAEVDQDPDASPLWGRYLQALEALRAAVGSAEDDLARDLVWELQAECINPESHRSCGVIAHCAICCKEGVLHE